MVNYLTLRLDRVNRHMITALSVFAEPGSVPPRHTMWPAAQCRRSMSSHQSYALNPYRYKYLFLDDGIKQVCIGLSTIMTLCRYLTWSVDPAVGGEQGRASGAGHHVSPGVGCRQQRLYKYIEMFCPDGCHYCTHYNLLNNAWRRTISDNARYCKHGIRHHLYPPGEKLSNTNTMHLTHLQGHQENRSSSN